MLQITTLSSRIAATFLNTSLFNRTIGKLATKMVEVERYLSWQAKNGVPVGKGLFFEEYNEQSRRSILVRN